MSDLLTIEDTSRYTAPDDDYEEADDVPQERDAMDIAHEYAEQCQVEEELAQ